MKLKHFSLLFSIIGILLLYFLSTLAQPQIIDISEIPKFEGKTITTQGFVKSYQNTKSESQVIEIGNNNSTVKVFVQGQIDIEYGDLIKATGEIQKYRDEWEIIVDDKQLIIILQKWNNISAPIWQLAKNPTKHIGTNVNVTGFIDDVYDEYFYLVDLEDKFSVIVFYNSFDVSLFAGQKACVLGSFLFDEQSLRYKIDINQENHGIFLPEER